MLHLLAHWLHYAGVHRVIVIVLGGREVEAAHAVVGRARHALCLIDLRLVDLDGNLLQVAAEAAVRSELLFFGMGALPPAVNGRLAGGQRSFA